MEQHDNFERATAVGLTSGRPYRVVEADRVDTNTSGPPPLEATFEETLNLIGQGAADNQQVHVLVHTTVNANGEPTAEVFNYIIHCAG